MLFVKLTNGRTLPRQNTLFPFDEYFAKTPLCHGCAPHVMRITLFGEKAFSWWTSVRPPFSGSQNLPCLFLLFSFFPLLAQLVEFVRAVDLPP